MILEQNIMQIDLIGGTYEHRFKSWNAQRTINWYPKITDQKSQEKNKTQIALFPRPGLSQFANVGGECIRGLFTAVTRTQERLFAVSGTTLYEIYYDGSYVSRGSLTGMATGSKLKVYAAINGNSEMMIQDSLAAYIFDLNTNTLTRITDIDYPGGTTLDYADGYFIISDGESRVTFSDLNNGTSWTGSSFFTPTFKPDGVKAIVAFREEVYCFGDDTIEIYINDGDTPFIRQARTSLYFGLTARHSIAIHHSGMFFLGRSRTGGSEVYQIGADYSLNPLSSPGISDLLNAHTNEDAEGFVHSTKDGHIFYYLHLPALNTTLVYDVTTGLWHERNSLLPYPDVDGTKRNDMFRGRNYVSFKGLNLFGDWHSGKIFIEDASVSTDDGNIRILKRISPVFHKELKNISVNSLEFDINTGTGNTTSPVMMLSYSRDGGNTFDSEELLGMGETGLYDYRVRTSNLGTARNWVIEFSISDAIDVIMMQAEMHGSIGAW